MPVVKSNSFSGAAGVSTKDSDGQDLATTLRALVDDVALVKSATVTSPNAADLATAITLANEIKTILNAIAGTTATVTKG